jgi:hypothetical protein
MTDSKCIKLGKKTALPHSRGRAAQSHYLM